MDAIGLIIVPLMGLFMSKAYATLVKQFFRDLDGGWTFEIQDSEESLKRYIVDHPHEFPNSCLRLTHDDVKFNIPIDTTDNDVVTAAIVGVCECGYDWLLKTLLPFWTAPNSIALKEAADAGHIVCAELLLGVCDAKFDNSVALRYACMNDDAEMFNLLLPVSDANAVLDVLKKRPQEHMRNNECFERLQAIVQHQTIGEQVASLGNTSVRKL